MKSILLIVPEGIEIMIIYRRRKFIHTFNRTRRNWNGDKRLIITEQQLLLIVPEGIEISVDSFTAAALTAF